MKQVSKCELHCQGEKVELIIQKGESIKEALLREFGWLINPITKQTDSFDESMQKLGWKIKNNENNSNP
jgi:hypothetical protein